MKIIDETGVELTEAPDLSLGRLIDDVEIVPHEAIAGVKQVSHFVPIEHLANGSTIVEEVIDVPGVTRSPLGKRRSPSSGISATPKTSWQSGEPRKSTRKKWRRCPKHWTP